MQGEFRSSESPVHFTRKRTKRVCKGKGYRQVYHLHKYLRNQDSRDSETILRIGKVLGTRSALTVSKWCLYVYSMLKNWNAITGILLPLENSIENLIWGKTGVGMKSLYSVIRCFSFVKVK